MSRNDDAIYFFLLRIKLYLFMRTGRKKMFKVSYFMEVLPIIASKVNITFQLTIAATVFALIVGVIIAIIGYYKVPVFYQFTRLYVSIMRGTPVVAQLYFFYYGVALYSAVVRIIIPQAVRIALPPLFNDIINLIKMTSLAFMLGVPDIMGAAKIEGARTFRYFEIYAAVMLVYWIIILLLGFIHKVLEKKCANMY